MYKFLKKIRHLIKAFEYFIVIYIDHETTLNIIKQTFFIIFFIDKLNLQLIRALNYLQKFNLEIQHKLKKHIIFNVFSRLTFNNIDNQNKFRLNKEFDVLFLIVNFDDVYFIITLMKINLKLRKHIVNDYRIQFKLIKNFRDI